MIDQVDREEEKESQHPNRQHNRVPNNEQQI
jgi:hypothetical protein